MLRAASRMAVVLCGLSLIVSALPALAAPGGVVISEFRFRGPSGGNDEFVELYNTGSSDVPIGDWKLEGCAASSGSPSTRVTVPAGTTLPAGGHYLFANRSSGGYSGTVPADATYTTGLSDDGGVRVTDTAGLVQDGVASADGVDQCREGTGLTLPGVNGDDTAFERLAGGTRDTDDNATDFAGPKAGDPNNLAGDEPEPDPEPEPTPINQIQGSGSRSPLAGNDVIVEGVVTGVDDEIGANFERTFPEDAGIFIQSLDADVDANAVTSEGIFIGYVRDRGAYPPGTVVTTEGEVKEKFGFTMVSERFGLEPEILGTADVPAPVTIDPTLAAAQDPFERAYYETLEGMRVRLVTGTANSGGTNKFGELFLTPGAERNRVFRTDPAPDLLATDADAGAGDPNNPFKPAAPSTTLVRGDLFDRVRNVVGPFAYSFNHYKIMVQPRRLPRVLDGPTEFPYAEAAPTGRRQLRVASFNVENFFPPGEELDLSDVTREEYAEKRARLADAIDNLLERPEIVAVQEVFNRATLQALAADLGGYTAYLEEGNDERGIDVGFLVADGIEVGDVTQYGKDATGPEGFDCSDVDGGLYDRPPLAIEISDGGFAATVFSNHFSSKSAPDECRQAQAAFLEDIVADLEADGGEVIVTGDLNAFEDEPALTELTDGETSLRNLWFDAPAQERYSFAFSGKLQTLDHMLVTDGLDNRVDDFRYAHFDNDYYEREDPTDGHRVSDHDPPLGTFSTSPCADPDARDTVFVEGNDTEVPNRELSNGCTINDVLPVRADYGDKGDYVAAVSAKTNELKADGIISGREKGQIMRAAAKVD
ncbi:MAG: lamin tail domain-containing protein [Actinomycetota bacterium]|nr:lamin tail domain-containing protein [Actinomycetota bacterium]